MIGHQAIGCYLDIPSFIRLLKQPDEGFVIFGVKENILPSHATIHDMIPSAWVFNVSMMIGCDNFRHRMSKCVTDGCFSAYGF